MINLKEVFEKFEDECLKGAAGPCQLSAFNRLERLGVCEGEIVAAAEHDKIYLGVDIEKLAEKATEEDILFLVRNGVMYNEEFESLAMFV